MAEIILVCKSTGFLYCFSKKTWALWRGGSGAISGLISGSIRDLARTRPPKVSALQVPSKSRPTGEAPRALLPFCFVFLPLMLGFSQSIKIIFLDDGNNSDNPNPAGIYPPPTLPRLSMLLVRRASLEFECVNTFWFKKGEVTYYTPGAVVKLFFWLSLIYLTPLFGKRGEKQAACNMYYLFFATIEVDL